MGEILMDESNITNELLAIIATKRDALPLYASHHEAYSILKDRLETVEKHIDFPKMMKEDCPSPKELNIEVGIAYASQLDANALALAKEAAAKLAAYAAAAARM